MIDTSQKKYMLGSYGERILSEILRNKGYTVQLSMDPFDSNKDFVVDGSTFEVKTQVPFYVENAFSIKQNQHRKCNAVDFVAFITVPTQNKVFGDTYGGNIYIAESKSLSWYTRKTKDDRMMYLTKINQPAMKLFHTITEQDILRNLHKLKTSQV